MRALNIFTFYIKMAFDLKITSSNVTGSLTISTLLCNILATKIIDIYGLSEHRSYENDLIYLD